MNIVITPDLEIGIAIQKGVVTVPYEDAIVRCNCPDRKMCAGIDVDKMPLEARTLQRHLYMMGQKFIERMAVRGYKHPGKPLRLHGPWPSYDFNNHLANMESSTWAEAMRLDDPSLVLGYVFDRTAFEPYMDYLLIGEFLTKAVWTEIIVPEEAL